MPRGATVDLLAQPPDEDVDGAVAVTLPASPQALQQLVARDDAALLERERVQEPELGRRQVRALAVHVRLHLARVDPQLLDLDRLAARRRRLRLRASAAGRLDAGDELLHRERLDEVVVGADLERVHAVVLRAARADDDDRRPDPFGASRLDELPAVEPGQHEVEHAHVVLLVAQAREPCLAARRRVTASNPAAVRCWTMPVAMTSSSSMMSTFVTRGTITRLLRHGLELVAHSVTGLDERVARRAPVDLLTQLAHEHVDRAVAIAMAPPPDSLHELVAGHDLAGAHAERV